MSNESRLELLKLHRAGVDKYVYFLLASAGAAIAFAVSQTQTASLTFSKIPLGIAVVCWAVSFWCGCRHISETNGLTLQNYQLMRVEDGLHPRFSNDPRLVAEIEKLVEQSAENSGRFAFRQYRLLIAGAAFFVIWQIIEMYLRMPSLPVKS